MVRLMAAEVIEHGGTTTPRSSGPTRASEGPTFFSPPESSFQFGLLAHEAGYQEKPHFHSPLRREIDDLQQMFVVQRGVVEVQLFTDDGRAVSRGAAAVPATRSCSSTACTRSRSWRTSKRSASSRAPSTATRRIRSPSIQQSMSPVIPVFEPHIGEEEAEAVAAAVRRGEISGSFGDSIPAFEERFAELRRRSRTASR